MSSLSDVDSDLLEQLDVGDTDEKFAALTSDVAVAAVKKILFQRNYQGKSCSK